MSLPILLALVIGGIAGIALLLHLAGLTASSGFSDHRAARNAWEREVPEFVANQCFLSTNGHAALITFDGGAGLVWTFGADTVARILPPTQPTNTEDGLRFIFPDFGSSAVQVHLNAQDRALWLKTLEAS